MKPVDKVEYNEEDHKLHARIQAILKSDEDKCSMICTLLGMAGVMTEFIHSEHELRKIPIIVKYAMANIAGNLMAFMSGERQAEFMNFATEEDVGEQTEEKVFRKMKIVVESLYKYIQENEKV